MDKFNHVVSICKIDTERRVVKGPVLRPEMRDRQGTIIGVDVILDAAHDFLSRLNADTDAATPGFMHKEFNRDLVIVESHITDQDQSYELKSGDSCRVPEGSWMMAVKVNDDKIWEGVQNGTFKGFSIGGRARLQYDDDEDENQED